MYYKKKTMYLIQEVLDYVLTILREQESLNNAYFHIDLAWIFVIIQSCDILFIQR